MSFSESVPPLGNVKEPPSAGAARLIDEQETNIVEAVPMGCEDTPTIAASRSAEIYIMPVALKGTAGAGTAGNVGGVKMCNPCASSMAYRFVGCNELVPNVTNFLSQIMLVGPQVYVLLTVSMAAVTNTES